MRALREEGGLDREGVVGCNLLGEGIAQGILDGCLLLGVLDDVVPILATLGHCVPRNNKHFRVYLFHIHDSASAKKNITK